MPGARRPSHLRSQRDGAARRRRWGRLGPTPGTCVAGGLFIAVLLVILGALAAQAVTGSVTGWMLRPWWHLAGAGAGLWAAATAILLWDLARP